MIFTHRMDEPIVALKAALDFADERFVTLEQTDRGLRATLGEQPPKAGKRSETMYMQDFESESLIPTALAELLKDVHGRAAKFEFHPIETSWFGKNVGYLTATVQDLP